MDKIVMYYGAIGKPGHYIKMLNGDVPIDVQIKVGNEIDADVNLYSAMNKCKGIGYNYYRGVTMLCIPYSIYDSRYGSKSVFIMNGKISKDEITRELQNYPSIHGMFTRLCIEHNLTDNVEELMMK